MSVLDVTAEKWKLNFRCDIIVPVRSLPELSNDGGVNGAAQPN